MRFDAGQSAKYQQPTLVLELERDFGLLEPPTKDPQVTTLAVFATVLAHSRRLSVFPALRAAFWTNVLTLLALNSAHGEGAQLALGHRGGRVDSRA